MSATTQTLEVTTEQMSRMMDQAKKRARVQFIGELELRAAVFDATEPTVAKALRAYCEELREVLLPPVPKRTPVAIAPAVTGGGEADPLDTVDERVSQMEQSSSVLPEVQHLSDETEALGMVRNLGARGKLNLPRD